MENRNRKNTLRTVAFAICRSVRWLAEAYRTSAEMDRDNIEMRKFHWRMDHAACPC